jgi:hypothetical protein
MKRRLALGARRAVALGLGGGNERAERTLFLALRCRPIEAVMLSFGTHDSSCIFMETITEPILGGKVSLRFDIGAADLDRVQLVPPDSGSIICSAPALRSKRQRRYLPPYARAHCARARKVIR